MDHFAEWSAEAEAFARSQDHRRKRELAIEPVTVHTTLLESLCLEGTPNLMVAEASDMNHNGRLTEDVLDELHLVLRGLDEGV